MRRAGTGSGERIITMLMIWGGLSEVSLGHALTFQSLANFGLS